MNEDDAISTADALVQLIIQYQPNMFATHAFGTPDSAKAVARAVAALRSELIEQLLQQK